MLITGQVLSMLIPINWALPPRKVSISNAHGISKRLITASATSFSGEIITSIGKCSDWYRSL